MEIEYLPIGDIAPYPGNAKLHPAEQIEQIKKSIEEFGFNDPIAIWKNNEVIEGHGRLIAAEELGLETVPVIRLDDLTDEQRRAYILVHNKLTMNSGFDEAMLQLEIEDLEGIDLEEYGFDVGGTDLDEDYSPKEYYDNQVDRTDKAVNLDIALDSGMSMTSDFWQMPVIQDDGYIPDEMLGFKYAMTAETYDVGIHFYIDDYQFERVWHSPGKYIDLLSKFQCILSPDFSLYLEMPMPLKIWNVYRSRLIGAYYQQHGIKVIPTVQWAEPETYAFCFEGIPKGSVVSISTVGVKTDPEAIDLWRRGTDEMIRRIDPRAILVYEYGKRLEYDYGDREVRFYKNIIKDRM